MKKTTIMRKSKIYTINNDLLTKLEETTVNEGVFVEIRIHVREGEIVATGSERRSGFDSRPFHFPSHSLGKLFTHI